MMKLRPPQSEELPDLSALCQRSKAYWGYDAAFMQACIEELTLTQTDLDNTLMIVAEKRGQLAGFVQVSVEGTTGELCRLYIEPDWIGQGVGRMLFDWAATQMRQHGVTVMSVVADPSAAPFYQRMGFKQVGQHPSGSIPGRMLPMLELFLKD